MKEAKWEMEEQEIRCEVEGAKNEMAKLV